MVETSRPSPPEGLSHVAADIRVPSVDSLALRDEISKPIKNQHDVRAPAQPTDTPSAPILENSIYVVATELLALPFCFSGVEGLMSGDWKKAAWGFGSGLPIGIAGLTFPRWRKRLGDPAQQWISKHGWKWLPVVVVLLFGYVLGPEAYQRATLRLAQLPSVEDIAVAVVAKIGSAPLQSGPAPRVPTADEIAQAVARDLRSMIPPGQQGGQATAVQSQLDAATRQIAALTQQIQANQQASQPAKSVGLGLDDAQFWRLLKKFKEGSRPEEICWINVSYPQPNAAGYKKTVDIWSDINMLLYHSDWKLGQQNNCTFFPPGISIYVNSESGPSFNCASRLADLLRSFNVEVSVHANTSTPSLAACNNQCADVALGQINGQ